jgi:hypothetical protein
MLHSRLVEIIPRQPSRTAILALFQIFMSIRDPLPHHPGGVAKDLIKNV